MGPLASVSSNSIDPVAPVQNNPKIKLVFSFLTVKSETGREAGRDVGRKRRGR